jgi:hypothetical protein
MNNLIKKWANELNRHFPKEAQMANKYIRKIFNILCQQRNAYQNYIEIPSHPSQNGYIGS